MTVGWPGWTKQMAITDKTRKTLWGRSGNRCAQCRRVLVIDASAIDHDSVVGEECHIVSPKPDGPRHDPDFPVSKLDQPANLILLCRVHHKQVDDQTRAYTVEALRSLKAKHEAWVTSTLSGAAATPRVRVRRPDQGEAAFLLRLTSGRDVFATVDRACAYQFDHDDLDSEDEADLVAAYLQTVHDYGEISSDLESGDRVKAVFELGEQLRDLEESGFWVFGQKEVHRLEGGEEAPAPFPVAVIRVVRATNPEIVRLDFSEGVGPAEEKG